MVTPKKVQLKAAAMNTPTKSPHGNTVSSLMSPADASNFTGRYETTVIKKDGTYSTGKRLLSWENIVPDTTSDSHSKRRAITCKPKVLRSLRNVPRDHELLLRGSLTPTPKKCAGTAEDIDDLCGALSSVIITPTKKGAKLGAASAKDSEAKVEEKATSVKISATSKDKVNAEGDKKIPAKSPEQPVLRSRTRRGGAH